MSGSTTTRRQVALGSIFLLILLLLPLVVDGYYQTMLTTIFITALVGIAWNLMMGFAGQLSLGHALYFGIGAYVVALMAERYGLSPWLGFPVGFLVTSGLGLVVGFLGFRFGVKGVYFALLTIAFAEFARLLFEHWDYVGKTGGLFLGSVKPDNRSLITLRGSATFYYYAVLATTLFAWLWCGYLVRSRLGYFWRAVRDDEDAARALGVRAFRVNLLAAGISAGITGIAGGWFALMNGNLFPESVLGMRVSIDFIIAPIVGGLGTLCGPILGALIVVPLNEIAKEAGQALGLNGLNILLYGTLLFIVIVAAPDGCWPWLANRLALAGRSSSKPDGP